MRTRLASLLVLAFAVTACGSMFNPFAGVRRLVSVAVFVVDVIAILDIITSKRSTGWKVIWTLIVLLFPIVGVLAYAVAGRSR